jgi:hypothetical protein
MWYLIALIWLALVAGIIWAHRRKRRRISSERAKEMSALLAEAKLAARSAPEPQPVAGTAAAPQVAAANTVVGKSRLLASSDALLYLLLRTGLPDHEVFANLTLADVVEPVPALRGYERELLLRKLALHRLTMVVCNKQLEIVAAVLFGANAPAAGNDDIGYVEGCLNAAGVRVVRIDPAALPRHQQVRALVYGETAPGAA